MRQRFITKEQKKRQELKKKSGRKSPRTGLENQKHIESIRGKPKYTLGRAHNFEEKRYSQWKAKSDIKRSFWIWCGKYSNSPKESEIAKILSEQNLRFYREVSFDMSKRFDFYIPLIDLVIEYDGRQHFTDLKQIDNDVLKEKLLNRFGIKYIRYNKTHALLTQIPHDLIYHPVLMSKNETN